jgi:uncharacterized protein (UPF0147 family)
VRNLWRAVQFYQHSKIPDGIYIMSKEIEAEAVLENCRALIKQIKARLSAEKPFVNASSAAELLVHLESAASALKRSLQTMPGEALN